MYYQLHRRAAVLLGFSLLCSPAPVTAADGTAPAQNSPLAAHQGGSGISTGAASALDLTADTGRLESSSKAASGAGAPNGFHETVSGVRDAPRGDVPAEQNAEDGQSTGRLEELSSKLDRLHAELDAYQRELEADESELNDEPTVSIGGRVHLDYWGFPESDPGINVIENNDARHDPENRWQFRRIRLEMGGTVPDNMVWRIHVDFNNPQTPEIKDVYLGWTGLPNNQTLILGNQKRPHGLDHLNSSRFNVFIERPMAVESFNEDARRFGLGMYGHSDDESTGWGYGIYNLENINTDGRFIGDSMQMGGYGRYWRSPWYDETSGGRGYWHMGLSGAVAHPDGDAEFDLDQNHNEGRFRTRPSARSDQRWLHTGRIPGADWYETLALESILNIGSLQLTGEYFFTALQRDRLVPPGGFEDPFSPPLDDDFFFHGGYLYASYFLTGEFNPYSRTSGTLQRVHPHEYFFFVDRFRGGRGGGWGAWQVALRYDYIDLTDGGVRGGVGNLVTGALNWHWTAHSKVQNNLIWGDIADSGNAGPFDGGDFWILGMRFMIDF